MPNTECMFCTQPWQRRPTETTHWQLWHRMVIPLISLGYRTLKNYTQCFVFGKLTFPAACDLKCDMCSVKAGYSSQQKESWCQYRYNTCQSKPNNPCASSHTVQKCTCVDWMIAHIKSMIYSSIDAVKVTQLKSPSKFCVERPGCVLWSAALNKRHLECCLQHDAQCWGVASHWLGVGTRLVREELQGQRGKQALRHVKSRHCGTHVLGIIIRYVQDGLQGQRG